LKTILSIIGGLLITLALGLGINQVSGQPKNPENIVTTTGGMTIKMGNVTAELAQTNISVGSGGSVTVPLANTAKEVASLMDQAGVVDTDLLKGNLTVCLISVVAYKTELNGYVSTQIANECRNFTPGMMAATIKTFAEDYTVATVTEYKTNHTFINKGE
jgi:hypothetical protein